MDNAKLYVFYTYIASIMPRPKLGKVRVNLTVRKDVLEASREYIPNLSQFFEDRLLEFLRSVNRSLAHSKEWTGGDLNPRPSPCQGDAL
ncbi:MAG: type II toxin-antitoxin system CcdA family antitoxin, partial [Archaeoglobus sp.]|uniref:type II toxin-antitoxin system CcdA family antitoxin n=1 Tax=Archaeoglobus sp. TaxID=1872626 RepID=UPI001D2D744D